MITSAAVTPRWSSGASLMTAVPIGAIVKIERRHGKEESAEPESVPVASLKSVNMPGANLAAKVAVLPGMVEMIMCIVLPAVMPYPLIIAGMDVRRLRMPLLILVGRLLVVVIPAATVIRWRSLCRWCHTIWRRWWSPYRRWPPRRNVAATHSIWRAAPALSTTAPTLSAASTSLRHHSDCE